MSACCHEDRAAIQYFIECRIAVVAPRLFTMSACCHEDRAAGVFDDGADAARVTACWTTLRIRCVEVHWHAYRWRRRRLQQEAKPIDPLAEQGRTDED